MEMVIKWNTNVRELYIHLPDKITLACFILCQSFINMFASPKLIMMNQP